MRRPHKCIPHWTRAFPFDTASASVNSAIEDRALAALYAEAGVEEYWIVLPVELRIEVYRQPEGGSCRNLLVAEGNATIACASLPAIHSSLGELF